MYLIAKNKYRFNMPVERQLCHLLDIWHLDKAHWFTLCGVSVGEVFTKSPSLVKFNLKRFGRIQEVNIEQSNDVTTVNVNGSRLDFSIEPFNDDYHYLHVSLSSKYKALRLLWPLIQIVFFLTVLEDSFYYGDKKK